MVVTCAATVPAAGSDLRTGGLLPFLLFPTFEEDKSMGLLIDL